MICSAEQKKRYLDAEKISSPVGLHVFLPKVMS